MFDRDVRSERRETPNCRRQALHPPDIVNAGNADALLHGRFNGAWMLLLVERSLPSKLADATGRGKVMIEWMDHHAGAAAYLQAVLVPATIIATLWAAAFPLRRQQMAEQRRLLRLALEAGTAAADTYRFIAKTVTTRDIDIQQTQAVIDGGLFIADRLLSRITIALVDELEVSSCLDHLLIWVNRDQKDFQTLATRAAKGLLTQEQIKAITEVASDVERLETTISLRARGMTR